jgi:uncharacterized protein (TIGR03437 family)
MARHSLVAYRPAAVLALLLPMSGLADMTGTTTLSSNSGFNLDAGSTPGCTADIFWTGTGIGTSGKAVLYAVPGAGGSGEYDSLTLAVLTTQSYQPMAISSVVVNDVFAVKTNAGSYAKVLVTAAGATSITLQYTTYGATAGAPVITQIANNYSYSNVAPGSLFVIFGCGLATPGSTAVLQDATAVLPQTLNGASVSVTVGSATSQPALYYATATQIAGVLPSATPTGSGTLTVQYGSHASSPATIDVWPTAFGFDSYDQSGFGMVLATDVNYELLTPTHSAMPNQMVTFWGSGLGADPQDSDTTYTSTPHSITVPQLPLQVLIGGIPATIQYQGRSPYPGLNQINVQIPPGVPTGCAVSVVAVNSNYQVISNSVTLPVSASGGTCTDPLMGISAAQAASLSGKSNANIGVLAVEQSNGVFAEGVATASFSPAADSLTPTPRGYSAPIVSLGSCVGNPVLQGDFASILPQQLDAGVMTFNGPGGSRSMQSGGTGYSLALGFQDGLWNPLTGGTYTFSAAGGKDVGAFTASLNFPILEAFPSLSSGAPIAISTTGQIINWTGGSNSQYITFSGTAGSAGFVCNAPAAAGTFTIPPSALVPLSGAGTLSVQITTYPQTITIPGIDAAYIIGYVTPLSSVSVTYY